MKKVTAGLLAFFATVATQLSLAQAATDKHYYEGKTLRLVINFAPGGAADAEGRLFAIHIGRLIEGQPKVLGQNVPGSGGMTGTNYIGNGQKDGLLMGYLTGPGARAALEPELFKVDFRQFGIVAYNQGSSIYYVRTDVTPGLKKPADLLNAEGVYAGGISAGSSKDLTMRLTLDMLGVKHDYITGYAGAGPIRLAFERGEVNLLSDGRATYNTAILPMVQKGEVLPVYVDTGFDGEILSTPSGNADMDIPPFHEFYHQLKGQKPSGILWDAYLALLSSSTMLQRVIAFPPGTPEEAIKSVRAAVSRLNTDADWRKAADKAFGFVPEYETGEDIQRQVMNMITIKPEVRKFILQFIERGQVSKAKNK